MNVYKYISYACLLTFMGCNSNNVSQVKPPEEGKFIDSVSSKIAKTRPTSNPQQRVAPDKHLVKSDSIDQYLSGILNKIITQLPNYQGPIPEIVLTIDRSYMAASSPDTVVISTGALQDAQSEDEIAYLLAHELAHVALAHHQTNLYFQQQATAVNTAVNVGIMVNKLRDVSYSKTDGQVQQSLSEQSQSNINKAYLSGLAINRLSRDLINSSLSRDDEIEADLLAIDLMTAAGYSPTVAMVSLERLKSARVFTEQQLQAKQNDFQGFIDVVSQNGGNLQRSELGQVGYLIANSAVASYLQNSAKRHPDEDARLDAVAIYLKREYRVERKLPYNTDSIATFKSNEPLLDRYVDADQALDALLRSEFELAEQLARRGVAKPAQKDSYTRYVFSMVRDNQNNESKAVQNLDLISNWNNLSIQGYQTAAQIYRNNQHYPKAQAVLDTAIASLGRREPFYPELIALQVSQKNHSQAEALLAECIKVDAENIVAQCYNQAGYELPPAPKDSVEQTLDNVNSILSIFSSD